MCSADQLERLDGLQKRWIDAVLESCMVNDIGLPKRHAVLVQGEQGGQPIFSACAGILVWEENWGAIGAVVHPKGEHIEAFENFASNKGKRMRKKIREALVEATRIWQLQEGLE